MFLALACLAAVLIFSCYKATKRYGQIANPICLMAPMFAMQTVIAPWAFYALDQLHGGESAATEAVWLSALQFVCTVIPFFLSTSPLQKPLAWFCPKQDAPGMRVGTMLLFLMSYLLLMAASGAGLLWIKSPRDAYQNHRAGVGVVWALCEGLLMLAFSSYLVRLRTRRSVYIYSFCFAIAAYFLGSKGVMLGFLVIGVFFIQHRMKPLSNKAIFLSVLLAVSLFPILMMLQGTAASIEDTVLYFDYFSNAAMFLHHFGEFGHTWGATLLGELWFYVPRFLYSAKPYAYGSATIMEHFNPGMAALGGTPGILGWAGPYLDFGVVGVAMQGFGTGFLLKAAYHLFLDNKNAYALIIFVQVMFGYEFPFAPLPVFLFWLLGLFLLFRCVNWALRSASHAGRGP